MAQVAVPEGAMMLMGETEGMSELMMAAFNGDHEACALRLYNGDDPNDTSQTVRGFTPLMLAVLSSE
jgi:ankyrin repeat protein